MLQVNNDGLMQSYAYYSTLLSTPTVPDSLQIALEHTIVYKAIKQIRTSLFGQSSDLYRISSAKSKDSLRAWRTERLIRSSKALQVSVIAFFRLGELKTVVRMSERY